MRIAIFINSLAGGGAERVVSQIIPYLEVNGFEVYLILADKTCAYTLKTKIEPYYLDDTSNTDSNILKLLKIPVLAFRYHLYLNKYHIDKSLSFLTRPNYISIISRIFDKKRNIIISERSNSSNQYGYNDLKSYINIFLIKFLYPRADLIITNSKGNANDLISNFNVPKSKIITIYNPISIKKICEIEPNKYFYDSNYFNLVSVGRLDNGKNHHLLLKTILQLKSQKIRLYIFGDGELRDHLQSLIKKYFLEDFVFLMGFNSNPYEYLKSADLFVFASNHEGFPNVLLEAMLCNLPIVTTNCPSGPNELMESEIDYNYEKNIYTEYGVLVPRNNEIKMAEAISYMAENKSYYENCKNSLRKRVLNFDENIILEEFRKVLMI